MNSMINPQRSTRNPATAQTMLFDLQVEQHDHDENYHREIARLSLHQRLNHMALHFAKYTGKLAATRDTAGCIAIYVDTLIIALSTANILNIELWDFLEKDNREFPGLLAFGRALAIHREKTADHASLVQQMAIASGRIAAACEKIDHLEEISFRAEIREGTAELSKIALVFLSLNGIDPGKAVRDRLEGVKRRLKLHHRM